LEDQLGVVTLRDPRIKALVGRALDAARSAGAQYADVRVTVIRARTYAKSTMSNREDLGLGVRALVNGAWGFASSSYVADDEASRLGRLAAANAKSIATSIPFQPVELGNIPVVSDGEWTTPIRIDPFDVAEGEILDWLHGLQSYAQGYGQSIGRVLDAIYVTPIPPLHFVKQERVVGSTEGSYFAQTLYRTSANLNLMIYTVQGDRKGQAHLTSLLGSGDFGAGWESIYDITARIRDSIPQRIAEFDADQALPVKPLDVGRYDVLFGAVAMANILSGTLGPATQLDVALGYEANATGTSYLGPDPHAVLGTAVAAPAITVSASRSMPRGLATVQWDDEGVVPADFPLVQHGTLVDYQTTREQAAWLAPWYRQQGQSVQSRGCSWAPSAQELPMQHIPNLTLQPGVAKNDFETLLAGMTNGLAVVDMNANTDFQCLNGLGLSSTAYEVKGGKRVARLMGGHSGIGVLFRSPEFWKNVLALGGPESAEFVGLIGRSQKGEPAQSTDYSVSVVPAVVKQLAVIDPTKKARTSVTLSTLQDAYDKHNV
jgi:TldD protein